MSDSPVADQERQQRIIEAVRELHAETAAKLSALRKRQADLYRRISERIGSVVQKKLSDSLRNGGDGR